jgi:hypothetical protein
MADVLSVQGTLVACEERAYGSFTDRQTGEVRPGGATWWAHVVPEFDQAPVAVKVRGTDAQAWSSLIEAGWGALVKVTCDLRAQGDRITRSLLAVEIVATVEPEASSGKRSRTAA